MFAEAMLGPGLAIDPPRSPVDVVAPISGTIASLFPHAVGIEVDDYSILVHLGLETVKLNGRGFTLLKAKGDTVEAGEPVIQWDPSVIESEEKLPVITPVVAIQVESSAITQLVADGDEVQAGTPLYEIA